MLTYIVFYGDGRSEMVTAESVDENEDSLTFRNGQKLIARFVNWNGWKLVGHVS